MTAGSRLQELRSRDVPSPLTRESQDPIRGELFSPERLEDLAERVARQPVLAEGRSGRLFSPRVRDSGRVLLQCYREIAVVIREEGAITPAAEWFVDNFHVADEVVRQVREDLPRGFNRQLPKLAEEPLQGYPRVLGLAWAFVAHTDSRFEPESLQRFVRRFQHVQPLTIGELWAIPIAIRLVLVENLRRLAERIVNGRAARLRADALADELLGLGGRPRRPLAFQRVEGAARSPAFMVNLVQRLREQDPESTPALRWLDEQLTALGTSADALVQLEHQNQAAMNVTVRNVITSMRLMSAVDWAEFFESVSLVDAVLRAGSDFAAMDFPTRDRYRHAIEALTRGSAYSELEVAGRALRAAQRAAAVSGGGGADSLSDVAAPSDLSKRSDEEGQTAGSGPNVCCPHPDPLPRGEGAKKDERKMSPWRCDIFRFVMFGLFRLALAQDDRRPWRVRRHSSGVITPDAEGT